MYPKNKNPYEVNTCKDSLLLWVGDEGLQEEFNITADNMDKLQSTGKSVSTNLDLMDFLKDKMKELDCHN